MGIAQYVSLRKKRVRLSVALHHSGLTPVLKRLGIILLLSLCLASAIHHVWSSVERWSERLVLSERQRADENLQVINHILKGRPLLVDGEWRAIFTCPGIESKI